MTRQELHDMITDEMYQSSSANKLADRILAALAKEHGAEVVLDSGSVYGMAWHIVDNFEKDKFYDQFREKRGQLIFRPTKAEKGGE